ncbi:hypothetical protein LCGC14_0925450, partial [marine sediment metagenome]
DPLFSIEKSAEIKEGIVNSLTRNFSILLIREKKNLNS